MKTDLIPAPQKFAARLAEAARYWEPRRISYNLVLTAVFAAWIILTWPHFRPIFKPAALLPLLALCAMANVCYTAAYLADIPLQSWTLRERWQRQRRSLWLAGTIFAILIECYWIADEIYSFV